MQLRLPAVEQNGPSHERAALRLGARARLKTLANAWTGLIPDLKLVTDALSSRRGTFAKLFPATHPLASIFQPERACDGKVNTVVRAVGVHVAN